MRNFLSPLELFLYIGEFSDLVEGEFSEQVLTVGLLVGEVGGHVLHVLLINLVLRHDLPSLTEGVAPALPHAI